MCHREHRSTCFFSVSNYSFIKPSSFISGSRQSMKFNRQNTSQPSSEMETQLVLTCLAVVPIEKKLLPCVNNHDAHQRNTPFGTSRVMGWLMFVIHCCSHCTIVPCDNEQYTHAPQHATSKSQPRQPRQQEVMGLTCVNVDCLDKHKQTWHVHQQQTQAQNTF